MQNMVTAEFRAAPGKLDALIDFLREALPDTRSFEGCISLAVHVDREAGAILLIEDWRSLADYDRYLAWRVETGLVEAIGGLLEGGAGGMAIRKLEPLEI